MSGTDGHVGTTPGKPGWGQVLGVTLRPWSGHSPISLLVRGAIQSAVCVFLVVMAWKVRSGEVLTLSSQERDSLRGLVVMFVIVTGLLGLTGGFKLVVGVLDLVPRREVSGTVESLKDRKFLDVLPNFVQQMLFERNENAIDRRRERTELVLRTGSGLKRWTLRRAKARQNLQVGDHVTLKVSPLAGYVASIEQGPS